MNKIQIPWEDRPVGCTDVMWRYSQNPVIGRYHIPSSNSIFNSAVVPFEDGFAGVFRCDNKAVQMNIFAGFSKDGIHWDINHEPIQFKAGNTEMIESEYKYDPRVTWIEDRYWVTWCNGYHGPTIGIAYTFDFKEFFQCENAFLPFNRNGVLFPQKIDGKYAMLSRPSDNGHTPFGDIYISYSPDMKYWGEHRCVMKVTPFPESAWQCTKIGAGSVPFLTDEGWLLFYHGVITTCNGFRYATVNDYVQFGHIYQVKLGAGDRAQRVIDDVLKLSVPNASGEMVPFSSFTRMEEQLGMDQINRYNMYSTAAVTCNVAPGSSSGEGIQQMESLIKSQLGDEFGYEWTSVAYQETQAGTTTTVVFVMALLVAFLVLAAQYESWTSPVAAVMGLPVALLGAMLGCYVMGTPVSIYTQIGIILLVALSAKNGILIVEFARDFRAQGNSIRDAAFQAGHIRLRPILMTSLAFVFGVMPLLFATGAGAGSRIALGAAVVFGMALNTLLATVYIPNFYELMQKLQEKFSKKQ